MMQIHCPVSRIATIIIVCVYLVALTISPIDAFATITPSTVVAVPGATGRTGSLVVERLLERNEANAVVAIVRNETKAEEVFPKESRPANLHVVSCDLTDEKDILKVLKDGSVDAAIWCATGFSATEPSPEQEESISSSSFSGAPRKIWNKLKGFFGSKSKDPEPLVQGDEPEKQSEPPKSIDLIGLPVFAQYLLEKQKEAASDETIINDSGGDATAASNNDADSQEDAAATTAVPSTSSADPSLPRLVLLSSAGVTRPSWNEEKRKQFIGAADIPIVRLNPFGILGIKLESEKSVRKSGVKYCVVRPCGLNDEWPSGARPVLSQGDVAVGRINRKDVANLLVDVLAAPEATGKTFEAIGLAGYPKAESIGPALSRLFLDNDEDDGGGGLDPAFVAATYTTLQQLLPGEKQDSAALAMGQSYEQYDKGQDGRFGKRGTENAEALAPQPTAN